MLRPSAPLGIDVAEGGLAQRNPAILVTKRERKWRVTLPYPAHPIIAATPSSFQLPRFGRKIIPHGTREQSCDRNGDAGGDRRAFGGVLGVQKWRTLQSRSQLRVVFEGGSASGLRRGGPVNFDGVPAGQILSIKLDNPRKVVALVMLDNSAPIRKDTVAGIEFQGLTGVAAVSLIGGAPSAPPVPLDSRSIPVLTADLSDADAIVAAPHSVDRTIVSNAPAIKEGLRTFETYTADLRSKAGEVD